MVSRSLLLLSFLQSALAAPQSGTFNVVTLNVAGLPAILNGNDIPGDKTANTASIGQKFATYGFSLIHVQEDFNYHATLYANDNHPYRTATSGGVPFGSGLNTLSNFDWIDFERTKWATCSDASGSDCLTPKGFTFMRVKVSEGVWVDAYNLHADAGTEAADNTARAANLRQVSDHITQYSAGNAVLVFGDTNSRYTRADDIPAIFTQQNGMTDAWVQLAKGGVAPAKGADALLCNNPSTTTSCEIVDKVWYRGSPAVNLSATRFQYAGNMFLQADGNVLSDHDPVLVDFSWTLGNTLRVSDYVGGPHGDYYNDLPTLSGISSPSVSSITLRGENRVDAVSITLSSGQTFTHGGTGGTANTLKLNAGEKLVQATICQAKYNNSTRVFYMQILTSSGRSVTTGKMTSDCYAFAAESGWGIVGFVGRSADEVDRVAMVYGKA
ncbi:Endonuclease/exonuclease/phosphatase [Clohesyomyces aquaticus]|uniref:Endonuclease/exonuclease/phosphatase n=1 Tax=Clohesyomyces aquaticus TaxID=1231657 RepID=A0A1Y1ZMW3_9PLEO|nr:Endonuclease/exonuclease/phosphatase [Clohesyomyces aquaticus]